MFIDKVKIHVRGGNGGNGAVAWRREKFEPAGGPYGGDGGNGGDVIIKVDEGLRTLMDFKYKSLFKAEHGENGRTKRQFGKAGEDLVIKVPPGTLVKDAATDQVIVDLKEKDQTYVIAKGGRGGRGNAKFATSTRQAPSFAEPGTKGEQKEVILELKSLAEVGLIGFPNVGKSTIISTMSAAKPKIANYHFTTLQPNLGVVRISEGKSFVMADIPGLIEGASEGIGLGHDFLRHVERTGILVHVIDISGIEGRNPINDFYKINEELKKYNEKLSYKPQIVCANKMDLPNAEKNLELLREELKDSNIDIIPISAGTKQGIDDLKYAIWDLLSKAEVTYQTYDEEYEEIIDDSEPIIVRKDGDEYIVEGSYIERLLESTYFDDRDSLRYFQEAMRKTGVVERLEELGIDEGEVVNIAGYEFEFFY